MENGRKERKEQKLQCGSKALNPAGASKGERGERVSNPGTLSLFLSFYCENHSFLASFRVSMWNICGSLRED